MPRVRRGPGGPKSSLAGKRGTNKKTPSGGAGTSGKKHEKMMVSRKVKGQESGGSY